ncbi:hypothetical protein [Burkholderia multivorans]|nr:hypothetical protein [Burkholderia multivorans]
MSDEARRIQVVLGILATGTEALDVSVRAIAVPIGTVPYLDRASCA